MPSSSTITEPGGASCAATTRTARLGPAFTGHITGLSSVAVKNVGAGGGSIAWIDSGGLLRVGPQSAGAEPGPACYDLGGKAPTVTDATVVTNRLGVVPAYHGVVTDHDCVAKLGGLAGDGPQVGLVAG